MTNFKQLFRLFSRVLHSRFLNIEDALDEGKLRFFTGTFANGRMAGHTSFYVDVPAPTLQTRSGDYAILPILNDLAEGKDVDYRVQKGYDHSGKLSYRKLRINSHEDAVYINVSVYAGKRQGKVIVPADETPNFETNMGMTRLEARSMAHTILLYINARFVQMLMNVPAPTIVQAPARPEPVQSNGHKPNLNQSKPDNPLTVQNILGQLWGDPIA